MSISTAETYLNKAGSNKETISIYYQNKPDPVFARQIRDHSKRLKEDPAYRDYLRQKTIFGQSRRRSKEKGVTLPAVKWLERPDIPHSS